MKISLTGWKEKRVEINLRPSEIEVEEIKGNVKGYLVLLKRENRIEAEGEIWYKLTLTCSRCLSVFEREYRERIRHFFIKNKGILPREKHLTMEDTETTYYDKDFIDLIPVIRDSVLLSIPIKPLCREDCKGLCPVCGRNLNENDCEHRVDMEVDPRLERLKAILKKEE